MVGGEKVLFLPLLAHKLWLSVIRTRMWTSSRSLVLAHLACSRFSTHSSDGSGLKPQQYRSSRSFTCSKITQFVLMRWAIKCHIHRGNNQNVRIIQHSDCGLGTKRNIQHNSCPGQSELQLYATYCPSTCSKHQIISCESWTSRDMPVVFGNSTLHEMRALLLLILQAEAWLHSLVLKSGCVDSTLNCIHRWCTASALRC